MPHSDFSGTIPIEYSTQIIQEATQLSAALQLGTRVPMGRQIAEMPVPRNLPSAQWTGANGRKFYSDMSLDVETLKAEEIASVISVPNAMIEDNSINIWAYARPQLAEAIAIGLDDSVFWGAAGTPPSFPAGGLNAVAALQAPGIDPVDSINLAMSRVEQQGLIVTGHAADTAVRGFLRGVRSDDGHLLLGESQADGYSRPTLYGLPASYVPFTMPTPGDINYFAGNWRYLFIGVRQDIRFETSTDGVIVAANGNVSVSAFQDNVTLMKVYARFGCVIVKPVTRRVPSGANPFAKVKLEAWERPPAAPLAEGGSGRSAAKR